MRILQLCTRVPFPPNDGGTIAMYNIAVSLTNAGCVVDVLSFNTKKHFVTEINIDSNYKNTFRLKTVFLDASVKPFAAFLNLFGKESYNISRFYSSEFDAQLIQLLTENTYDIIQLEGLFMSPYLPTLRKYSKGKVVLRAHNIEYVIWQRLYQSEKSLIKKWYLKLLYKRLFEYEKNIINNFDALLPLTPEDDAGFKKMSCTIPTEIIPIGVNFKSYTAIQTDFNAPSIFHLGSMDWMPNIEGIEWFLEDVWQLLLDKIPAIQLFLAGKAMPQSIYKSASANLKVEGLVNDAKAFMASHQIMIVPLLSGSGMRVKILEGLAAGNVIVSTTIGAEGINFINGKHLFIADTPQAFVDCIAKLYSDKDLLLSISENARKLASTEYDNEIIGQKLKAYYHKLIG